MKEQQIIEQCAPTLAGIKTGSLFSAEFANRKEATKEIRRINNMLRKKGLCAIPAGWQNQRTLIYLYRPGHLQKDLCHPKAVEILKEKGYSCENMGICITQLVRRMAQYEAFPHEIGLFLGYPPSDVKGFMNSPKEGVQCVGYWKVYRDREKAEEIFRKYKKCTEIFRRLHQNGVSLSQLSVGPC